MSANASAVYDSSASGYSPTITASPNLNATNETCNGATLNVLGASLDWWYTETYTYAVSTFSVQFNRNDTQTGWTLLPATTTFNVTSAVAAPTCDSTLAIGTYPPGIFAANATNYTSTYSYYQVSCSSTSAPVAASTTVVSQTLVTHPPGNATTGVGEIPNVAITPKPVAITVPSAAATFSAGTPFVYFSGYEVASKYLTTHRDGHVRCATTTSVYNMTKPFGFEFEGGDVNGLRKVGEGVTGDVNPAFLGIVGASTAVAGSWVAAPTVVVVVQRVFAAQAVLAASTEETATQLLTPTPTLPSFLVPVGPTATGETSFSVGFTARVESTQSFLILPPSKSTSKATVPTTTPGEITQHILHTSWRTFFAHLGSSEATLLLPSATTASIIVTNIAGVQVTATAGNNGNNGGSNPTTKAAGGLGGQVKSSTASTLSVIPFFAHAESSDVTLAIPVNPTQTVVTAEFDGQTVTATQLSLVQPAKTNGNGGGGSGTKQTAGSGGGLGGLISAVNSAANNPTNALEVLSQAAASAKSAEGSPSNPTAAAIVNGLGGSNSNGGGGGSAVAGSGSGVDNNSGSGAANGGSSLGGGTSGGQGAAPGVAPVITFGSSTITANPTTAFVVAGQTVLPGGAAITAGGHTISVPAGAGKQVIVVDGSTIPIAGSIASSTIFNVNGVPITANPTPAFVVGGQTLQAGGAAITVSGTRLSLATGGGAVVIGSSTVQLGSGSQSAGAAANIPLITIGSKVFTANAATQFSLAPGATLTPGGQVVISGTTISLASGATAVIVNGQTQGLSAPIITPAPQVVVGSTVYQANGGSAYDIGGSMLTPGGVITVSGTTISLAADGSAIVVNGVTQSLASPAATGAPQITIGGTVYQANSASAYDIGGSILTPGGVITVSGTVISLEAGASAVVVNGKTTMLGGAAAGTPSGNYATITAPAVLTVDGQAYAANGGTTYIISGQTLTPGGAITISGANGVETISLNAAANELFTVVDGNTMTSMIGAVGAVPSGAPILTIDGQTYTAISYDSGSGPTYIVSGQTLIRGAAITITDASGNVETLSLDAAGTALIEISAGHTITSTISGAYGVMPTAAPILTIGDDTFTAINNGATYIIDGKTLVPGDIETVVVGGKTYIISLAPQATMLMIETENSNGVVTATSFETLFPAQMTMGTVTNTLPGATAGGNRVQSSATATSTGSDAGLQNSARIGAAVQVSALAVAVGSLALALLL